MNLKKFTEGKKYGFYVSLATILLALITAIVYIACPHAIGDYNVMNYWAFAFMLVAVVGGAALVAFKQYNFVPYVVTAFAFIGLLCFIYGIYFYASVVFVGIDLDSFAPGVLASIILFLLTTVVGIVDIFLPQTEGKETTKVEESEAM